MSNPIPNLLALTSIADGSPQQAAPIRNNYSAVQVAVNALITALKGGTAGALLYATDASDVGYLPDAPNDGDALVWNAAASRWKPVASATGTTYRKTTAKTVNTTVAATDLLNGEITVGAGVLGTTKVLRLTAEGDYLQNSGATTSGPRFQLLLGGVTLLDTGAAGAGFGNSATRFPWRIEVTIRNLGAANAQSVYLELGGAYFNAVSDAARGAAFTTGEGLYSALAADTTSNLGIFDAEGWNTGAVDTTLAKALVLNVINPSASASCETKLYGALAEIL